LRDFCGVLLLVACVGLAGPAMGQGSDAPAAGGPLDLTQAERDLVRVDWFEEMGEGGATMLALAAVSVALLAFIVERAIFLRRSSLIPAGLLAELLPLFGQRRYQEALELCEARPSALARTAHFLIDHRDADPQILIAAAGDLGARQAVKQEQRCQPFALIAGIAPLLGLLGTMIGMIESFKLVEVFGDEGGASLLAGSISKALITTAVGLILAIPALVAYHYFKHRAHTLGTELEEATEQLFNAWFLTPASARPAAAPAPAKTPAAPAPTPAPAKPADPASPTPTPAAPD